MFCHQCRARLALFGTVLSGVWRRSAYTVHDIRTSQRRDNSRASIVQTGQEPTTLGRSVMPIVNVSFVAFTARSILRQN